MPYTLINQKYKYSSIKWFPNIANALPQVHDWLLQGTLPTSVNESRPAVMLSSSQWRPLELRYLSLEPSTSEHHRPKVNDLQLDHYDSQFAPEPHQQDPRCRQ